jgi:DNA-binding CsgD family transcriptional regulator
MAIHEIINPGKDYAEHPAFYKQFLTRMKAISEPNSIYLKEFEDKMDLLSNPKKGYFSNPLHIAGIIILILLGFIWYLKSKLNSANGSNIKKPEPNRSELFETLTRREKEILALLIEDIQNKEIANKLNLEVSTIKTHIGKIYQKLSISNRNEVKAFEPYVKKADQNDQAIK